MDRVAVETLGFEGLIGREWIAANGLGGFASSTLCGMNTRKYHGLLVAAMAPPVRRMVILSRVDETIKFEGGAVEISTNEYPQTIFPQGHKFLRAFSPDPFPRWAYQSEAFTLEKSVRISPGENTVCISYTLLTGAKHVELELRPLLALRSIHELMYQWNGRLKIESHEAGRIHIGATNRTPEVFLAHDGEFIDAPVWYLNTIYRREQERGYSGLEDLWMPGVIRRALLPGETAHFVCSMEKVDLDRIISENARLPAPARQLPGMTDKESIDLVRSAETYVVNVPPAVNGVSEFRGEGVTGTKSHTFPMTYIQTHYPWSSPSVRGEMISMAGILLVPGRLDEARSLLETTAGLMENGVVPSLLPEDSSPPVFQGADVSLWFINAIGQYLQYTADEPMARRMLKAADDIIENYRRGTRLGIIADSDGLISTGVSGMPTTWMDAKLVDRVITPRQGRPVEINALWHNALRIVADLHRQFGTEPRARELTDLADSVRQAFNRRFWNEDWSCLYDVVDDHVADASVRPNQLLAVSLAHPVLWEQRHAAVIDVVVNELLTPMGVRTLSPRDPAYLGRYSGNVILRDQAYHQGSAYPWLLGPLVTAIVRTRGRTAAALSLAREILRPAISHLRGDGLGLICELFDGDFPHRPGGAIASAPAAGELLRAWTEDVLGVRPHRQPATQQDSTTGIPAMHE